MGRRTMLLWALSEMLIWGDGERERERERERPALNAVGNLRDNFFLFSVSIHLCLSWKWQVLLTP
jgi:hypothetical protein